MEIINPLFGRKNRRKADLMRNILFVPDLFVSELSFDPGFADARPRVSIHILAAICIDRVHIAAHKTIQIAVQKFRTDPQGAFLNTQIETLMRNGIFPYIVDTASQAYIFHPKVYITNNADQARLIVGSANATAGGMAKNVEASLYSELSMDTDYPPSCRC